MLWICIFLFSLQSVDVSAVFHPLPLPPPAIGPEALAFDGSGEGPYTGVADGRVLKYQRLRRNFIEFATTSPNRTKEQCTGVNNLTLAYICGRPLGIAFDYLTGNLYIADAGMGLSVVGRGGGLARQIASGKNGTTFGLANAVDFNPIDRKVYFTDSGKIFRETSNATEILLSGDTSGKLFKYDPLTGKINLLLGGLSGANGVAISADGSYVLIAETIALRIRRFWLRGPRANSSDVFATLQGAPDNIRRTKLGDFWVAVNIINLQTSSVRALGQRINLFGNVVASVNLTAFYGTRISEVQEYGARLFIGSLEKNFVGSFGIL